ncbi:MAG: cob(I)yrinic acid a,c-diamide adenosyltransferase [Sphingobacteriales bacterium]|jgi:cob(I)alamin adenosyltransferase|nr:cob(I)yrinic acid a,c-diamide adenosyltransferase [Sphingobacteriales bacterium]
MEKYKGYIHLYTGNGKGKTTAALGLALRAVGAGKRVFIGQFVKGMHYAEIDALKRFSEIEIKQYGLDCFIKKEPTEKDIKAAQIGLREVTEMILENKYDIVVMDEVCIALHYHLFDLNDIIKILQKKPVSMEIILTGRYAPAKLYELADLITEMKEIKHYYNKGVQARKGIEY